MVQTKKLLIISFFSIILVIGVSGCYYLNYFNHRPVVITSSEAYTIAKNYISSRVSNSSKYHISEPVFTSYLTWYNLYNRTEWRVWYWRIYGNQTGDPYILQIDPYDGHILGNIQLVT